MARYTRSPLGLVPPDNSEFRFRYKAKEGTRSVPSLFSSQHEFEKGSDHKSDLFESPLNFGTIHKEERYNISTDNIVSQLSRVPAMKLKYSDFVYCRDFGVYPNNRLIIFRRFGGPVGDNLTTVTGTTPIATLVTWFEDQNPPVSIDFGIDWVDAKGSFVSVLNSMGDDMGFGDNFKLGNMASKAFGAVPLPGVFEPFTRAVLSKITVEGKPLISGESTFIPAGSATLIKEAKQRKLIPDDDTGSSLSGKFIVKASFAWEQKFIGGIDPTYVYYDLLRTIIHFGTDDASFYMGGSRGVVDLINKFTKALEKPDKFIQDLITGFTAAVAGIVTKLKEAIGAFFDEQKVPMNSATQEQPSVWETLFGSNDDKKEQTQQLSAADQAKNKELEGQKDKLIGKEGLLTNFARTLGKGLSRKYKHQLLGIANTLSGAPSTPWHVTIGNPFRPILSTGDMYMQSSMTLKLGSTLAFNDLPSTIEAEITLTSARNLGASEIFRKLSTGEIRFSSKAKKTFYAEEEDEDITAPKVPDSGKPETSSKDESIQVETTQLSKTTVGTTNPTGVISSTGQQINSDPNSTLPTTPSPWQPPMAPPPVPNQSPFPNPSNNSVEQNIKFTPPPPSDEIEDLPTDAMTEPEPSQSPVQDSSTTEEAWEPGELVTSGKVNYSGIWTGPGPIPSINWRVVKGEDPGSFEGRFTNLNGNLYRYQDNSLQDVVTTTSNDAKSEIDSI